MPALISAMRNARWNANLRSDVVLGHSQRMGKMKEVAGKATGDAKLEGEGKAQKTAGKVQNTVGGMKDALKESVED